MSNIIKASQIIGEYKLKDRKLVQIKKEKQFKKKEKDNHPAEEEQAQQGKAGVITDAERKAAGIIKRAEEEVAEIKKQALKEIEQAKEEGYNQGYQDGYAAGEEEGRQQGLANLNNIASHFEEMVLKVKEELDNQVAALSGDLIKLAVRIAGKVVNAELEINPQIINSIVMEMVQDMSNFEEIDILVNPELEKYIVKEDFKSNFVKQQINFIGDSKLKMGDCIVKTHLGGRDGTIENKLALLEKELLKGVGQYEGA